MYRLTGNVKIFGLPELDLTQRCQRCLVWKMCLHFNYHQKDNMKGKPWYYSQQISKACNHVFTVDFMELWTQ